MGMALMAPSIRGWQAINASDMLIISRSEHGAHRSVLKDATAGDGLRYCGPDHA